MCLERLLQQKIKADGPVSVADFMALALAHPEYGYYMRHDPFGAGGDFTTAPEISQMFGEMIGAWVADVWMQMGSPAAFTLLECGPGRGTLMADMMRATKGVVGFHEACGIALMEISPVLKARQAEVLARHDPVWLAGLDEVARDKPLIVIANEFLDALPVHQYVREVERRIDYEVARGFYFTLDGGDVVEASPVQVGFMKALSVLLAHVGGAGLFVDYGYEAGHGDTLQAVYRHKYCGVLEHIGEADLTAHVNFGALKNVMPSRIVTQGAFLEALGIGYRAEILSNKGDKAAIQNALHRLTHDVEMGRLFKVMGVTHDTTLNLAGF